MSDDERIYPCDDCGTLRSKNAGGTTFTVCDECWDKHYKRRAKSKPTIKLKRLGKEERIRLSGKYPFYHYAHEAEWKKDIIIGASQAAEDNFISQLLSQGYEVKEE